MKNIIKVFVMDVDGTITDGKIYIGMTGEVFKAFDVKDGYAIHELLPKHGVKTVILTGRESEIVVRRAKELEIDLIIQGEKNKERKIKDIASRFGVFPENIAYIGDDIADLPAMLLCGVKGCPGDAVKEIKDICDFISVRPGGDGAVRNFIEWLIDQGYCEE